MTNGRVGEEIDPYRPMTMTGSSYKYQAKDHVRLRLSLGGGGGSSSNNARLIIY